MGSPWPPQVEAEATTGKSNNAVVLSGEPLSAFNHEPRLPQMTDKPDLISALPEPIEGEIKRNTLLFAGCFYRSVSPAS